MTKRMRIERNNESVVTRTLVPLTTVNASHGTGSPTKTSNMFDPIEEETAMSPSPALATITEVSRSGID
eukprot:CAMPEP_0182851040 /NCGR_PEP_ID=MMETSP0006_2-20121128/30419_1 /TAXON_ID=97485 /ORGANISM="Prymnesium parvum, Strain Texoma1" /LENGTH=68 /DNA_ID=CAMNT_0024981693 /DNA_START=12 /DNA_END=215 /DNA_ORIENTATION=-